MPPKATDKNKGAGTVAESPVTPDPPVPTFVPADEFRQFQATINGQFVTFQENFNAILANLGSRRDAPIAPAEPVIEDVTTAELEQALADGKGANLFVKAMDARLKKMEGAFGKRVQELESIGLTAISDLSRDTAVADMPYYSKFKKEIDAYVATLPAHLRVNKQVYVVAHNAIVGQHLPEILKEEKEKILREAADPDAATDTTGVNGRGKGTKESEIPTVEELLGKEAADALVSIGRTPDQHAQRISRGKYNTWAEYSVWIKEEVSNANG